MKKEMLLKTAIRILLEHAGRDLMGQGCGIRTAPTEQERAKAIEAAKRAFTYVYGWIPSKNDLANYGFY